MPPGTGLNDKFEIDKSVLGQMSAALKTECVSALADAKSAEQAGAAMAAAIQRYVEKSISLIEQEVEEQGYQAPVAVGAGAGGPGA